jgi:hypothetical protein
MQGTDDIFARSVRLRLPLGDHLDVEDSNRVAIQDSQEHLARLPRRALELSAGRCNRVQLTLALTDQYASLFEMQNSPHDFEQPGKHLLALGGLDKHFQTAKQTLRFETQSLFLLACTRQVNQRFP